MIRFAIAALALTMLAACEAKLEGPSAKISGPKVKIESGYHDDGGFCPPGQAKKGRC